MNAFDSVTASGALESIDLHFARLMHRQAEASEADLLAVTAGLLSRERGRGHSCIALDDWAGRPFPAEGGSLLPPLPDGYNWRAALAASCLVDDGSGTAPMVLDAGGRLYLKRYWHAEQRLTEGLKKRLSDPPVIDPEALTPLFRRLFPDLAATGDPPSGQAIAAATALARRVALISGGPGTGKTTLVGRLLALWLTAEPELRIALAAPTGKAAARLGEALAAQSEKMPISEKLRRRLPAQAATLHRLLGYQPRTDRFRHDESRPLAIDALVIDEVSMVDLLMMDAAIHALPPHARLVLLGDKDQLTSVETGSVFGDLCAAAHLGLGADDSVSRSRHFVDFFHTLSGRDLDIDRSRATVSRHRLRDAAVELTTSFRFRHYPGIGELARAVRQGDARRAIAVLEDPTHDDVRRIEPPMDTAAALTPVLAPLDAYLSAASPTQALERLGAFRVLCARRQGPWGIERLNAAVERHLASAGHPIREGFYPARPILITANDYQLKLFNGDLGVCWPDASAGRLWAFFPGPGHELRRLSLARLPPHETAWAMTVHKSQGSEFDQVLLVLGDADSRVLTRDLLYTGATRARRSVMIVASPEVLRGAVARRTRRISGLANALSDAPSELQVNRQTAPEPPVATTEAEPLNSPSPGQLSLFGN